MSLYHGDNLISFKDPAIVPSSTKSSFLEYAAEGTVTSRGSFGCSSEGGEPGVLRVTFTGLEDVAKGKGFAKDLLDAHKGHLTACKDAVLRQLGSCLPKEHLNEVIRQWNLHLGSASTRVRRTGSRKLSSVTITAANPTSRPGESVRHGHITMDFGRFCQQAASDRSAQAAYMKAILQTLDTTPTTPGMWLSSQIHELTSHTAEKWQGSSERHKSSRRAFLEQLREQASESQNGWKISHNGVEIVIDDPAPWAKLREVAVRHMESIDGVSLIDL